MKRNMAILALQKEFCPLDSSCIVEGKVGRILQRIEKFGSTNAPDVAVSPIWKSRHFILTTSFFLFMDRALVHES